jgi:hypothetical protein
MIAASITRPQVAGARPAKRFGLIDEALIPVKGMESRRLAQLKQDLAIIMTADALFRSPTLCGLSPDAAVASAVHTAQIITATALQPAH